MKKLNYLLGFALLLFIVAAGSMQAATISVPGPYGPTIQAAINAAAPGDTIYVAAGVYHEQVTIPKALTLNGADGAILDGTGLIPTWTTGVQIKCGNVTFNNIDVANFTQDGITAYFAANGTNIHITNCKISNIQPGYWGFGIYIGFESEGFKYVPPALTSQLDFSGLLIEGNEITNVHSAALVIQAVTGTPGTLVARNNYIHDNVTNSGIWIDCARNLLIEDNVVIGNKWGIECSSLGDAFYDPVNWEYDWTSPLNLNGPYGPKDVVFQGNEVLDNFKYGFYLYGGYPAAIFVNHNNITGNMIGAANDLAEDVDATGNWWGDKTGPHHPTLNPKGQGNPVTDYVVFDPWLKGRAFFEVEEAKVDFKKKPDDDKIHVKGSLAIKPGSDGVLETEPVLVTIGPFASGPLDMDVKGKSGVWEYDRPKGETGIKKMTIQWKGTEAEFDIHVDKLEDLGWGNPVTVTIQIGNDSWSQTILMDVKKDKWEYHK